MARTNPPFGSAASGTRPIRSTRLIAWPFFSRLTFDRLIGRAGLKKAVSAPGVTLLAPSDTAFAAISAAELHALNKDRKALRAVIARHIIPARIDAAQMKAINLAHTKLKLRDLSRELYMEHGWRMPPISPMSWYGGSQITERVCGV